MKRLLTLLTAAALLLSLAACGNQSGSSGTGSSAGSQSGGGSGAVDIAGLKDTIISDLSIQDPMDLPAEQLGELYGIDAADVADSACFITMGGTFPDEIVMVEAADADAAARISEKLEARLDEVKTQSQNYDEENYALAQACRVMESGNTLALFLSPQHEAMENLFEEAAK